MTVNRYSSQKNNDLDFRMIEVINKIQGQSLQDCNLILFAISKL